jgi:hypothetical protein
VAASGEREGFVGGMIPCNARQVPAERLRSDVMERSCAIAIPDVDIARYAQVCISKDEDNALEVTYIFLRITLAGPPWPK